MGILDSRTYTLSAFSLSLVLVIEFANWVDIQALVAKFAVGEVPMFHLHVFTLLSLFQLKNQNFN